MEKTSKRDTRISYTCWIIMAVCYTVERTIENFSSPNKAFAYGQAYIYFIVFFGIFLVCVAGKLSPFFSMMTSLIGFKMIPDLLMLKVLSPSSYIAYYLTMELLKILFVIALISQFRKQDEKEKVNALQILSLIVIIPFFSGITETVGDFTQQVYTTMIPTFIVQFLFYIIGSLLILYIAYDSRTSAGTHFVCNFQIVALIINFVVKAITIIVLLINGQHVSRSHYCWAVIFAFLMMLFLIVKEDRIRSKMREKIVTPSL